MMSDRMIAIMRERERLLARCNAQRVEVAAQARQWGGLFTAADRVVAGIDYLRRHPVVFGLLAALLTVVQRRGLWRWAQSGFELWRAYRAFRGLRDTGSRHTA